MFNNINAGSMNEVRLADELIAAVTSQIVQQTHSAICGFPSKFMHFMLKQCCDLVALHSKCRRSHMLHQHFGHCLQVVRALPYNLIMIGK